MAKSRVERNKKLYDELEKDDFELEDISEVKKEEKQEIKEEVVVEKKEEEKKLPVKKEEKKKELVPVKEEKKLPATRKEKKKKVDLIEEDDFVVEQPLSYTDKLIAEEALREKLERQQQLKDKKKGYKKTPYASNYTAENMQKNISQFGGVDVRKEVNLKVRRESNTFTLTLLLFLLIAVIVGGALLIYIVW